ncbi:MAG: c-type cytochrome [Acidimicrobiales bacterium]
MVISTASPRPARRLAAAALVGAVFGLTAACGGDNGPELSAPAAEGREIMRNSGCAGCHGQNGEGGVAPSWHDLYGSTVELDDGDTVTADDDYLRRSITDPRADQVAGYTLLMPTNSLSEQEVDAVIAYIQELG